MSTYINDAYKYHGKMEDVINILEDIRDKYIKEHFKEQILKYNSPTDIVKNKYLPYESTDFLLKDLDRWQFQDYMKYNEQFCIECQLSVIFYFDFSGIYCQFFRVPYDIIKEYPVFTDYHYQDGSDMSNYDETIEPYALMTDERKTELNEDWDTRKKLWDRVFDYHWSPVNAGFLYDLSPFSTSSSRSEAYNMFNETLNDVVSLRKLKFKQMKIAKDRIDSATLKGESTFHLLKVYNNKFDEPFDPNSDIDEKEIKE